MRKVITFFFAIIFTFSCVAEQWDLKFNLDSKFNIIQFTDLHITLDSAKNNGAYENIKSVITTERPNLIIITGDLIYAKPSTEIFRNVMEYINKFRIPFAFTFGNHDREFGSTNTELLDISKNYQYCITSNTEGIYGTGNCVLQVKDNNLI